MVAMGPEKMKVELTCWRIISCPGKDVTLSKSIPDIFHQISILSSLFRFYLPAKLGTGILARRLRYTDILYWYFGIIFGATLPLPTYQCYDPGRSVMTSGHQLPLGGELLSMNTR